MVEVGLGIHGEPGLAQIALPPATQLVELMVGILWGGESDAQGLLRVSVGEGGGGKGKGVSVGLTSPMPPLRVAPVAKSAAAAGDEALECVLVVNNLGGCSGLEMGVLAKAAAAAISSRGATVSRLLVGSMMTALDMKGFSLTILPLHAASALCPLIDAATSAPGWLAIALSPELTARPANPSDRLAPVPLAPELRSAVRSGGVAVKRFGAAADGSSPSGGEATVTALLAVAAAVKAAEPLLTALDTLSGDGDCGLTAHKGAMAIEAVALASALAAGYDASSIATMRESASRAGEMTMLELSQQFDPSSGKEAAASEAAPASASGATAASEAADTMASTAAGGSDVSGLAAGTVAVCALDDASAVLAACAEAVAASMGGSSGVLYAIMLSAASRAAAASADTGTAAAVVLAAALAAGATAVSELGGATQGCSTMVDALAPAATAATSAARSSGAPVSVRAVAVAAADAALDGAKATAGMRAMAGRASYSQADETLAAVADPGAVTVAVWLSVLQRICGLGEHE
jgi:dihydroxyacetone kinase